MLYELLRNTHENLIPSSKVGVQVFFSTKEIENYGTDCLLYFGIRRLTCAKIIKAL